MGEDQPAHERLYFLHEKLANEFPGGRVEMKTRIWNWATPTEQPGNIVELIWPDGRLIQLSTDTSGSGLCLLRAFPADPNEPDGFSRLTELSMTISFTPSGLEIRGLQTSPHQPITKPADDQRLPWCMNCDTVIRASIPKTAIYLGGRVNVCGDDCKAKVEGEDDDTK